MQSHSCFKLHLDVYLILSDWNKQRNQGKLMERTSMRDAIVGIILWVIALFGAWAAALTTENQSGGSNISIQQKTWGAQSKTIPPDIKSAGGVGMAIFTTIVVFSSDISRSVVANMSKPSAVLYHFRACCMIAETLAISLRLDWYLLIPFFLCFLSLCILALCWHILAIFASPLPVLAFPALSLTIAILCLLPGSLLASSCIDVEGWWWSVVLATWPWHFVVLLHHTQLPDASLYPHHLQEPAQWRSVLPIHQSISKRYGTHEMMINDNVVF